MLLFSRLAEGLMDDVSHMCAGLSALIDYSYALGFGSLLVRREAEMCIKLV